jgi:hypothetical protein
MKTESENRRKSDTDVDTTPGARQSEAIHYIETIDAADETTGLTIVDQSGRGVFIRDEGTKVPPRIGTAASPPHHAEQRITSIKALYPHWEDTQADAGIATRLVSLALRDLEAAADLSSDSGPEFFNHLVLAEGSLFQAVDKSRFNKAFEIVVHFCAWGLRNGALENPRTLSIQGMCSALREVQDSPFLLIDRAATIVTGLEKQGWNGESTVSRLFKQALAVAENGQTGLTG